MKFEVERKAETPKYPYLGLWKSIDNPDGDWDIVLFVAYNDGIVVASAGPNNCQIGERWDDEAFYKPFNGKVILEND